MSDDEPRLFTVPSADLFNNENATFAIRPPAASPMLYPRKTTSLTVPANVPFPKPAVIINGIDIS